ncbi:MAG: HAMP domain-containing histidine kinase [Acidimicrobiia bacterium]|nr:HAMP domain-containing histidine kinase [Acidimicrobiia bacterium]
MTRLPLRLRLTLLVAVLFGLALTAAAAVGISRVETSLRTDIRQNAEALLVDYLDQLQGGSIGPGAPGPEEATRFIYLDAQGNDLTAGEYQQVLFDAIDQQVEDLPILTVPDGSPFPIDLFDDAPVIVESDLIEITVQPVAADGKPGLIDRGDDVIAVGVPVLIGDAPLTVAVSSPLRLVTDSIDTLTRLLLVLVPMLTATIGVATWIIVSRALQPVHAITAQVERISTESLDQRVPQPSTDDELGHLAATMNRMLARLQAARDTQRQFISDAAHELRSPITATQATLELARRQPDQVDWPRTADVLNQENTRLTALVDDLLLLAQLEETSSPTGAQEVDLDELCLAEAQRPHPHPIHVQVTNPARINGNLQHLTRAIRNLVDNAAHHATSRVDITISTNHESAVIDVADDGPGIPPEDLERIFDRFTRVDTSRTRPQGGAGLGLAIAHQIADSHHGNLTAKNRSPSDGAQFTLTLPKHTPATSERSPL